MPTRYFVTKGAKLAWANTPAGVKKHLAKGYRELKGKVKEKFLDRKGYYKRLKARFAKRKLKEKDPVYKAKSLARKRIGWKKEQKARAYFHSSKARRSEWESQQKIASMERAHPVQQFRVKGRINPKSKLAEKIPGRPPYSQKKYKGGLMVKPKLAKRGF
tara:strand:- start:42 stop:521 length:480 start_codon:yes stop_codon:yes gene_type:complete